jgi:hypothetical protein
MPEAAAPQVVARIWSRRWVRRLTYLLASGATLAGLAGFLATRPAVDRWTVGKLDELLREQTGLAFQAERLEVHPFQGRFLFHNLSLGGDLFRADRLEVDLELGSLLRLPQLHIRALVLTNPTLRVDQARLGRLHLKETPPSKNPLKLRLDHLQVLGGRAFVAEPAWGVPPGDYTFKVDGRGGTANQVWLDVRVPTMTVGEGRAQRQGELTLKAYVTEQRAQVDKGHLQLGHNTLAFHGSYLYEGKGLQAAAEGALDLAEALALGLKGQPDPASGSVTFSAQASGPVHGLTWKAALQGRDLRAKGLPLHPGALNATAWGRPDQLHLDKLQWESQDGALTAQGSWVRGRGTHLDLEVEHLPLAPVAGYTRTGFLKDVSARFQGKATLPGAPWELPRLDLATLQGSGQFLEHGEHVGSLELTVAGSRLQVTQLDLDVPALEFHGKASAHLARHGLESLEATGEVRTDASDVAGVLKVWDIGSHDAHGKVEAFDMEGQTRTTTQFSWSAQEGIQLKGHADILRPRWHGARADEVSADVSIDRDVLKVTDILLQKDEGRGYGDLRLTWAKLPPGAETLDMCYRVFRLPIHEGLKAADIGDLPIEGTGSGWVRLHGPYGRIIMDGSAVAEDATAYGFKLPAASTDFFMDLAEMRLKTLDSRVADTLEHLAAAEPLPTGPLALRGAMDMDIQRERWVVDLRGAVDSRVLGLPGPHVEAWVEGRLDGPVTTPFGPYPMPTGTLALTRGTLTQDEHSLSGLEAALTLQAGTLKLQTGLEGRPQRLLKLEARDVGSKRLSGTLQLNLGPESADTAKLAAQLTQDFLKDAKLEYQAKGEWGPGGLTYQGTLDHFSAEFEGFQLAQAHPGKLNGSLAGMDLSLDLEGHTEATAGGSEAAMKGPSVTSLGIKGQVPFNRDGQLALQVAGSAELANLKLILDRLIQPGQYSLLADLHPGGTASMDLNLGGTLFEATLNGSLKVKDGSVSVRTYPQSIESVAFTAQFQGRDIIIPEEAPLTGTLAQGSVKAWGRATWQVGGLAQYDLHANVEDFQFRDIPEGFELQGSVDATLKGSDQDGGLLKGSLWAKRVLYRADINLQDLILANAFGASSGLSNLDPSDPLARIDLDLDLHLGEPWELDTNLLKLQGRPRGRFRVRGTLAQPGLQGEMEFIPGGRITNLIPAGDIVLERGSVVFKDPKTFNPNIDIQGRVDVPPYLVNLAITGTLDHIQANPTSTPSLKEAEIIGILIDPDSASSVGSTRSFTAQTTMNTGLANTSTGLLSSLALANFQEGLRKTLKLDRVSVALRSSVGATETSVILGKSVNLLGHRVPLVFTHRKAAEVTTVSGQVEVRFGNFILQMGGSQSTGGSLQPSGEIRHTWTPK